MAAIISRVCMSMVNASPNSAGRKWSFSRHLRRPENLWHLCLRNSTVQESQASQRRLRTSTDPAPLCQTVNCTLYRQAELSRATGPAPSSLWRKILCNRTRTRTQQHRSENSCIRPLRCCSLQRQIFRNLLRGPPPPPSCRHRDVLPEW